MRLVLFTTSYPYDAAVEQPFIGRELSYLAKYFEEIILIPKTCEGKKLPTPIPVKVEEGLCHTIKLRKNSLADKIFNVLLSRSFHREVLTRPSSILSPPKFRGLITFVSQAELIRGLTEEWIQQSGINIHETLFYTYWFMQGAMGVGLVKRKFPGLRLVSRAHGFDVYEERVRPSYWPCRPEALGALDK